MPEIRTAIHFGGALTFDQTQNLYSTSEQNVRSTFDDESKAGKAYADYTNFVQRSVAGNVAGKRLLDVGCGTGWSSYFFAERGFQVTGIDLNLDAFQSPLHDRLTFIEGSALDLPFEDKAFDVVCSYQALEHMPDPQKALEEMCRVCAPGGVVCIVGPNLLGLSNNIKATTVWAWKNRPVSRIFMRFPETPRHPYGNTIFESVAQLFLNAGRVAKKVISPGISFSMRVPDIRPPFHGDNDACYLCNPIDLGRFFRTRGFSIVQNGAYGRPKWSAIFAGGTWVAASKK